MSKFKHTQNYKPGPVQPGPDMGQIQVQKHPKKHELLKPQPWFDPTKPILSNVLILHSPKTFIPIDQTCLVFLFRTGRLIAVNYR